MSAGTCDGCLMRNRHRLGYRRRWAGETAGGLLSGYIDCRATSAVKVETFQNRLGGLAALRLHDASLRAPSAAPRLRAPHSRRDELPPIHPLECNMTCQKCDSPRGKNHAEATMTKPHARGATRGGGRSYIFLGLGIENPGRPLRAQESGPISGSPLRNVRYVTSYRTSRPSEIPRRFRGCPSRRAKPDQLLPPFPPTPCLAITDME